MFFFYAAGRDFSFLNTTLTFLRGESAQSVKSAARCVNIAILNDNVVEGNETFDVVISSSSLLQITGETSIPVTVYEDPTDCESVTQSGNCCLFQPF